MTEGFNSESVGSSEENTFLSLTLRDEIFKNGKPLFSKKNIFKISKNFITHAAAANNCIILALQNGNLLRLDLTKPFYRESIYNYKREQSKLKRLYLDPLGNHIILILTSKIGKQGEVIYLHINGAKEQVTFVDNHVDDEVTDVAWNYENKSDVSTGLILLGTSKGYIMETEIKVFDSQKKIAHQLYRKMFLFNAPSAHNSPVTGVLFRSIDKKSKYPYYDIFVTISTGLHQFSGHAITTETTPSLQSIFESYIFGSENGFTKASSNLENSQLQFDCHDCKQIQSIGFLSNDGLVHQKLNDSLQHKEVTTKIILYNTRNGCIPHSLALSEFHVVLMYPNCIQMVSLLNEEIFHEEVFPNPKEREGLVCILKDSTSGSFFAVTKTAIFRYEILDLWKAYMTTENFVKAREHSDADPSIIAKINKREAELLFSKSNYDESAILFASTNCTVESIMLKFLEVDQINSLILYTKAKLDLTDEYETIPNTTLVMGMMEIIFCTQYSQCYQIMKEDFDNFLNNPKILKIICSQKKAFYELSLAYGNADWYIQFATHNGDYEEIILMSIMKKSYNVALNAIKRSGEPKLLYKYAGVLTQHIPEITIDYLIQQGSHLDSLSLLLAFYSCEYDSIHMLEIARYLDFIVKNLYVEDKKAQIFHNYLLSIYVEYDQVALLSYLDWQGFDPDEVDYNINFALGLCLKSEIREACVKLLIMLKEWDEALIIALKEGINLAKSVADKPEEKEVKIRLWLLIARHIFTNTEDIAEIKIFLNECPLVQFVDIYPFFKDFLIIDEFRNHIVHAIQECNDQMRIVKEDIQELFGSVMRINQDLKKYKHRHDEILATDVCAICESKLLDQAIVIFPCQHKFHVICLLKEWRPLKAQERCEILESLQLQLESDLGDDNDYEVNCHEKQILPSKIDDIVGNECLYCGDVMIELIDTPFFNENENDLK